MRCGVPYVEEGSCVLCCARTYCARENPKKIQSSKNNPKKFPKKLQKFQIILLDTHNPTQPREDGAVEETKRREYFAFCVWIRFRVVNGGMMDGMMDGTMDGTMERWMMGEVGRASERRRRGPRALSLVRFGYPGFW